MELKEYQQNALRTESIIDKLEFDKPFIVNIFKMFVINSELLDAVKKEVYYKNPKKMDEKFIELVNDLTLLNCHTVRLKDRNTNIALDPRVFHGIIGIASEAGELLNVLVKYLVDDTPIDAVNVQEELADISWYTAILNDALGLDWGEGLARNIAKLKARYPEKYTHENAMNRNLDVERAKLEGQQ